MGADGVFSPNMIKRVPSTKPPFTLGQVKKAIPPHCFERSLLRSAILPPPPSTSYHLILPTLHGRSTGFSKAVSSLVFGSLHTNAATMPSVTTSGSTTQLAYSSTLRSFVPYFSWKFSHRRHHSNIGCLDLDEVFVPKLKSQIPWHYMYLKQSTRPSLSPIYSDRERLHIYISDLGIFATTSVLCRIAITQGLAFVISIYGVPLLFVNGFLVLITYLQHTHPSLPHYDSAEWDWLRGALVTVDRDYGILNKVFHNITDTHVAHHLVATIPHYHAMEATEAIKPVLGEFYQFDSTPFYKALWREARECLYVEPDEKGVFWFMNKF
ncbi:hypothetical protein OIU84_023421 [Salix udensis]|uniref:Fatty acid desaturase domain-containing protein n=1 Tax=Salix udensis TaxID=889485 RepID=A0AAD6PFS2_9ROSI|nr:hypothetical protein OIU84_023421 [Salix udensis]